jgi:hypothetical protein
MCDIMVSKLITPIFLKNRETISGFMSRDLPHLVITSKKYSFINYLYQ